MAANRPTQKFTATEPIITINSPILPDASRYFAPVIVVLSLIAVIYIGMVALVQTDMKKLVAYSSISIWVSLRWACSCFLTAV